MALRRDGRGLLLKTTSRLVVFAEPWNREESVRRRARPQPPGQDPDLWPYGWMSPGCSGITWKIPALVPKQFVGWSHQALRVGWGRVTTGR